MLLGCLVGFGATGPGVAVAAPSCAAAAGTVTCTFLLADDGEIFAVPTGVTAVTVQASGAQGGSTFGFAGGLGGRATATVAVTPAETLEVHVGGRGGDNSGATGGVGGSNGGASGGDGCCTAGAGGGGASDVRLGGGGLADRVVVGGGGGGQGGFLGGAGGSGGGASGGGGGSGGDGNSGGQGGTQGAGGGGAGGGASGGIGTGGVGAAGAVTDDGGGGGGGGWYGGGGGSAGFDGGGGGGGGSGYGPTGVGFDSGVQSGDGLVVISYTENEPPVAVADSYDVVGGATLSVPAGGVLTNDSDADNDVLTADLVSTTSAGSLALDADGSFSYTPGEDTIGTDSFTYRAYDGTEYSNTVTVTITVQAGCDGRPATIVGTSGKDKLRGGSGDDVIVGLGGNDTIDSGSGRDIVCGGAGNDTISTGSGNDTALGGSGNDNIRSGSGNDTLHGDAGNDSLDGGGDDDDLFGDAGIDELFGGGDEDALDGGADGPDTCNGEGGTDTATGCEITTRIP